VSDDFGARLNRWSQRKAAARSGAPLADTAEEPRRDEQAELPVAEPLVSAAPDDAPAAADSLPAEEPPLPPIEELTAESDYTVFLGRNVPEELKRAALRKLWRSDPVFANLDGLNDYDDDYSLVETLAGSVQTAYQSGKGYVEKAEEKLAQLQSGQAGEDVEDAERLPAEPAPEAAGAEAGDKIDEKKEAAVDDADAASRQESAGENVEGDVRPAPDKAV
jgi:hypothetical protein